jgi:hypothetical protein
MHGMGKTSCVALSQVVGLRDHVAIIRALLHACLSSVRVPHLRQFATVSTANLELNFLVKLVVFAKQIGFISIEFLRKFFCHRFFQI